MRLRTRGMIRAVLQGEGGPLRDVVLLNAAAALFIAGRVASVREGLTRAGAAIDSGDAIKTLEATGALLAADRGRS